MNFAFGIDNEAEIYRISSAVAIKNKGNEVIPVLNNMTKLLVANAITENSPYSSVINKICSLVEEDVKSYNWDVCDEDGVSFIMGLYCKAYIRSLRKSIRTYDIMFKDCFKEYFRTK